MSDGGDRFDQLRKLDEETKGGASESETPGGETPEETDVNAAASASSNATESTDSEAEAASEPAADSGTGSATGGSAGSTSESASPSGPAFGFDEAKQRPLYARPDAWDAFDDALALDVERILRDHGVRDADKREYHDAALRVLGERGEEVAREMLRARGVDVE